MSNFYDAVQSYADGEDIYEIVNYFGQEEGLTLRVNDYDVDEDGEITVRVSNYTPVKVDYFDSSMLELWDNFVNDLIPVSELSSRAEEVSEDLNEKFDELLVYYSADLEYRIQEDFDQWFEKNYGEKDQSVLVSVYMYSNVEIFSVEYLIDERKLIRDNR